MLKIHYEEHYDPSGNLLFKLHVRGKNNPLMIYSLRNPDQAIITFSVNYSPTILANIDIFDRIKLRSKLKELRSKLSLQHILRLENNSMIFTIGIILNADNYDLNEMKPAIENLIVTYDHALNEAITIIKELCT